MRRLCLVQEGRKEWACNPRASWFHEGSSGSLCRWLGFRGDMGLKGRRPLAATPHIWCLEGFYFAVALIN